MEYNVEKYVRIMDEMVDSGVDREIIDFLCPKIAGSLSQFDVFYADMVDGWHACNRDLKKRNLYLNGIIDMMGYQRKQETHTSLLDKNNTHTSVSQ